MTAVVTLSGGRWTETGNLVGGILIDAIGGTRTLAVLGVTMCALALAFTPPGGLRAASLAPAGELSTGRVAEPAEG